jgi:hypothetical protein
VKQKEIGKEDIVILKHGTRTYSTMQAFTHSAIHAHISRCLCTRLFGMIENHVAPLARLVAVIVELRVDLGGLEVEMVGSRVER